MVTVPAVGLGLVAAGVALWWWNGPDPRAGVGDLAYALVAAMLVVAGGWLAATWAHGTLVLGLGWVGP